MPHDCLLRQPDALIQGNPEATGVAAPIDFGAPF
jgi:hypothetical protein